MTEKLQTYKVTIRTLSPVFIGGGKAAELSPYTDYIQQGNQIIIIDQRKFRDALVDNHLLIDEFVQEIRNRFDNNRSLFSLSAFITDRMKLSISDVEQCRLPVEGNVGKNQIRRFIASSGRPFIPGSTIKGAFRTAVLVEWLLKNPEGKKQLAKIRAIIEKKDKTEIIGLDPATKCFGAVDRDLFKYLRISDSAFFDNSALSVRKVKRVSIKSDKKRRSDIPMWSEALNSDIETKCVLSLLNPKLLTGFPFLDQQSYVELLSTINSQSFDSCDLELCELDSAPGDFDRLKHFYEELQEKIKNCRRHEAIVRLGGGKIWFDNSIGLAVEQNGFIKNYLTDVLNIKHSPFPSTRSAVLKDGLPALPLGWVKLSVDG
jgi:CRISPR-associated protein Csm5